MKTRILLSIILVLCLLVSGLLVPGHAAADSGSGAIADRVNILVGLMTLDEKIEQLNPINNWQTAANDRLQIPSLHFGDGPHGVGSDQVNQATCFPVGIALAATWDPALLGRVGAALGQEFLANGINVGLGPCVDLVRDPRNGRTQETAGEDPYLAGKVGAAIITGMQSTEIIACVKHLDLNFRETGRGGPESLGLVPGNNYTIDKRTLVELYGLPFKMCIDEGHVGAIMSAYNKINGDYCSENSVLLTDILRGLWGYQGFVVSDWGALHNGTKGINAGLDVEEQPFAPLFNQFNSLKNAVTSDKVSMDTLNQAVARVLRAKIESGMMDGLKIGNSSDVNSPAHQQLAYDTAAKSIVLLKNANNVLPLNRATIHSIAVIGPLADDPSAMLGDQGITASSRVNPFYTISPLQGITTAAGSGITINYAKGCAVNSLFTTGFSDAINAANKSDVVIYVGGIDHTQEGETNDRVGGSIEIPGKQSDLINALSQVNHNVIVVLIGSGGIGVSSFINNIQGALMAWYPGQEAGHAIADVLFGNVNPSGKLPLTMPVSDSQMPNLTFDFSRDIIDGVGYSWYEKHDVAPQFAFGYGLSYTSFRIDNLVLSSQQPGAGEPVYVSVDVTDTGNRSGAETVQLYIKDPTTGVPMPPKQLKGFQKVTLSPGKSKTVTFKISTDELSYYDTATNGYVVEPGLYTAMVGNASNNIVASKDFVVQSAKGNSAPHAVINASNISGYAPLAVSLDSRASSDSDGTIVSYTWNFGDGTTGAGATVTHTYTKPGIYTAILTAMDDDGTTNTTSILVSSSSAQNLALNKRAYVSSQEDFTNLCASKAIDGNISTRWSSDFHDNEWIFVDLGAVYNIHQVVLNWETASAKKYKIQISNDAKTWVDLFSETKGKGGTNSISVSGTGRYVRMLGITSNIWWGGYSLYEFQIK